MSVQFWVRCDCWERGLIKVPREYADRIQLDPETDDFYIPYRDNEDAYQFGKWLTTACEHERMLACPTGHLNNSGYRMFIASINRGYSVIAPEIRAHVPSYESVHAGLPMIQPSDAADLLRGVNAAIEHRNANPPPPAKRRRWPFGRKPGIDFENDHGWWIPLVGHDLKRACEASIEMGRPIVWG